VKKRELTNNEKKFIEFIKRCLKFEIECGILNKCDYKTELENNINLIFN
jgi:hypothetical protein